MPYDKRDLRKPFTLTPELRQDVAAAAGPRAWSFFRAIWPWCVANSGDTPSWGGLLQGYDFSSITDTQAEQVLRSVGHRAAAVVQTLRDGVVEDPPHIDTSDGNVMVFSGDWPGGTHIVVTVTVTDVDGDTGTRVVDAWIVPQGASPATAAATVRSVVDPLAHVRCRRRGATLTLAPVDERSAVHVTATWV